ALTFQNHTDCPLTDFRGKTSIFSHPVYLFLRKFSLQDSRGGSNKQVECDYMLSALRRMELRGHLNEIYDGVIVNKKEGNAA
ncbi:hypothetical protein J2P93_11870, partial [Escherichia coli]|nr:hypothetical protein [Escherichia coli]